MAHYRAVLTMFRPSLKHSGYHSLHTALAHLNHRPFSFAEKLFYIHFISIKNSNFFRHAVEVVYTKSGDDACHRDWEVLVVQCAGVGDMT